MFWVQKITLLSLKILTLPPLGLCHLGQPHHSPPPTMPLKQPQLPLTCTMNIFKSLVCSALINHVVFRLPSLNLELLTNLPFPIQETLFPAPTSALAIRIPSKEP
jgi:hypothetical protein